MDTRIIYILDSNPLLKRYLREHSWYYKNLSRNSNFINSLLEMAKKEYHLTIPDRLDNFKKNILLFSTFMDILK